MFMYGLNKDDSWNLYETKEEHQRASFDVLLNQNHNFKKIVKGQQFFYSC